MKRLAVIAAMFLVFSGAGMAVARSLDNSGTISSVSGTFTATAVGKSRTESCMTANGETLQSTTASYTGTAASRFGDLNGQIVLQAHSTINTTDGVGMIEGTFKIGKSAAHFAAVYDHGTVVGLFSGHGATPSIKLFGDLSAGFAASGTPSGFTGGKIGGGTAAGSAVAVVPGKCRPQKSAKPQTSQAKGAVTALSPTSISVNGLTCAVSNAALVAGIAVNDSIEIRCITAGGASTLVKVEKKKSAAK